MTAASDTLVVAEAVASLCRSQGAEPLLIGAMALACHGYSRRTEDVDLAVSIPPPRLRALLAALQGAGYAADLSESSGDDPLGGVITVSSQGLGPVQIINFDNSPAGGFPALVRDALGRAKAEPSAPAPVPCVEDLVLFKLYAGGPKSNLDLLELLTRTQVDWELLRSLAKSYGMTRELQSFERIAGIADPSRD